MEFFLWETCNCQVHLMLYLGVHLGVKRHQFKGLIQEFLCKFVILIVFASNVS